MNRKGNKNLEVAQHLINHSYFTQSVHCSYYAVFQFMKYVLAYKIPTPISYEEQQEKCNGDNNSSHEWVINKIKDNITNLKAKKNFTERIRKLKHERIKADYTNHQFSDIESCECKDEAEALRSELNRLFKAGL